MFAKGFTLAAVAAMTMATFAPAAAEARDHGRHWNSDRYYDGGQRHRGYDRQYARRGYYGSDRGYYGRDRGYYNRGYYGRGKRCDSGTGGTIIGAIAGGLLGHEVADGGRRGRGDGTTGAIVGAGIGALAGRAIDRNC